MSIGGLCGSVFLDEQFEKAIATLVGPDVYWNLARKKRRAMLSIFEISLKRHFGFDKNDTTIELRGIEDNEAEGIEEEQIRLT